MADLKSKQIKFPLTGTSVVSSSAQIATDISGSFVADSGSFSTRVTTAETELTNTLLSSSAQIATDISGSFTGELSGSGIKFIGGGVSGSAASTGSFGELEIGNGGDIVLTEDQRIYFEADKATYIESHAADSFRVVVNDKQMFLLDEDTGDRAVFGNGTKVFIGANNNFTPLASLHIAGNLWVSGSDAQGGAHVTASGNISSSATIISEDSIVKNDLTVGGNLDIADTIFHTGDSNTKIRFPDVDTITFHTSGQERLRISTGGAITASGDISSSATITANEFNGIFNGALSGSAQIATDISGSFVAPSASFSTRVTTTETELGNTLVSSSAQIADDISGSLSTAAVVGLGAGIISGSSSNSNLTTAIVSEGASIVSASVMVDHDATTNFVANEHIDHTSVSVIAGTGLTGGGTIAANRTLNVIGGTGVTANANDMAIGQDVATDADVEFATISTTGNITAQGDIIAENYIVSSSVTFMTSSAISGSSLFGDTQDDTHQFTGSVFVTGSTFNINAIGSVSSSNSGSFLNASITDNISATNFHGQVATAAQTGINSILAENLKLGEDAQTKIDFETANEIHFDVNNIETFNMAGLQLSGSQASTGSFGSVVTDANMGVGVVNPTLPLEVAGTGSFASVKVSGESGHISGSLGVIKGFALADITTITNVDITTTDTGSFAHVAVSGEGGQISGSQSTLVGFAQANITSGSLDYINVTGLMTASGLETSGDVIAFGSSDRGLKDDIQPIENPLEKMEKIGGYTFVWNDKQNVYKGKDVGVVAQEIQSVLPEIVATRANGYLGVKYEKIVPLLIESIKELNKKIEHIEKNCDCLNK